MNDSDKTREQLIQEIELLRTLIDALPDRLYVKDIKSRFVICNKAVAEDTDLPLSGSPIGKNDFDLFPPELAGALYATEQEIIKTGKPMMNEEVRRMRSKDGQDSWSLCTKLPWRDENGNIIGIIGANRDITEEKKTEQAMRESEARYKTLFESAKEGIIILEVETKQLKYANPASCRMFGYTVEELCRMTVYDIHPKEDAPVIDASFAMNNQSEEGGLFVNIPCTRKDGTVFFTDVNVIAIMADQKLCHLVFFTDVTEQKYNKEALRESETRYKAIFESAREGIVVGIIETRQFMYANPAICEMFGYTAKELTGMAVNDIHPKKHLRYVSERFEALMRSEVAFTQNIPCLRKNGTVFYADINATRIVIDNKDCFVGFFTDTTERKHAEDALRESEEKFRGLAERSFDIIFTMDASGYIRYISPACEIMLAFKPEEVIGKNFQDFVTDSYLQPSIDYFTDIINGHALKPFVSEVKRKDNAPVFIEVNISPVLQNGKVVGVQGVIRDITEHKHTEEALRESEARYKAILNSATEGIVVTDIETKRHRYANPALCRMFGYTAEEFQQMSVYDIHPKEYMTSVIAGLEAQARGEKTLVPNVPCLHRNGTVFYADVDATCVVIDQRPCNVGLFTDITERKHTEEALRESEEKFRGIADRSFDMIFITDTRGFIKYLSPASERIFGYKPEEMAGKHFANFLLESEIPKATKGLAEKLRGKKLDVLYLEAKKKDGSRVFIELNSSLIIQDGKISGTQGIIKDVTERRKAEEQLRKAHEELEIRVKQRTADLAGVVEDLKNEITERKLAEESLRNAEERFRTIFENTIVGLYRTTPDGRILLANPALVKMMGCRSFKELAKFNVEKNGFDPSTPRSIFKNRIKKDGRVVGLDSVWLRPDGTKLFVSESAFAVKDRKGKIAYYEGTAQDITKRKEAEEKLMLYQQQLRSLASELSLAEERLRRRIAAELHDHIAQNLAISKIKLESLTDNAEPDLVKSLNEICGLLSQTIEATRSLTFEVSPPVLYELGFEAAVNWLAKQTRQRFGLEVDFSDDGKPKPLDADIRVLLFQAVRELLVNVVKHARAKKAKVFTCRIQKTIQITVEDNGIGFNVETISAAKDPAKGGFGLFNIRERLDQIGGSVIIDVRAGKGTRITLTAPIEKQKKPRTRFEGARPDKNRKRRKKKE